MSITIERYITPWNIEYERGLTNDMLAKTLRDQTTYCYKLRELVNDMLVTVRAAGRLGIDVAKVEEYGRRASELGIEVYG